jgi:hypothetical protein
MTNLTQWGLRVAAMALFLAIAQAALSHCVEDQMGGYGCVPNSITNDICCHDDGDCWGSQPDQPWKCTRENSWCSDVDGTPGPPYTAGWNWVTTNCDENYGQDCCSGGQP